MWIYLPDGFLSIVADNRRPAGDQLLVRSRKRRHISAHFPHAEIIEGGGTDYGFRAWVPREQVKALMINQVDGLNYGNFKDTITDDGYHDAALESWWAMRRYQDSSAP